MKISIIGLGFVGSAMYQGFKLSGVKELVGYDKYKNVGSLADCIDSDISFLALPTKFNEATSDYDLSSIIEVLTDLNQFSYSGVIVIKSTVIPGTVQMLSDMFKSLSIMHNPEFLTERTALQDFQNQSHIVLGVGTNCSDADATKVKSFYSAFYPNADISQVSSTESESMKLFANSFYAVKVQFFNELYLLCNKIGCSYESVLQLMLKNGWINPMHTTVPGPDGSLSYGGSCFPKDTNSLLEFMKRNQTPHGVLEATVTERNTMRKDSTNIITN